MAAYNEDFRLTLHDIELIDCALGERINALSYGAGLRDNLDASDYSLCKFNRRDIELIENAVRDRLAVLTPINLSPSAGHDRVNDSQIKQYEELLGTLYNQKVWYSQVHHTGVPLG